MRVAMRVVICGAKGQLGSELVDLYRARGDEVLGFDLDLDITLYDVVMERIPVLKPDLLINSAAHVDADAAESNPELSYRVNFTGTQNLALAARRAGCPLVFLSSDYVFDGFKGEAYNEFDEPHPRGVYARAKVAAECYIPGIVPEHYIFRTQWLFGKYGRRNFVKSIIKGAKTRGSLRVVTDEVGTPTGAGDLAEIIARTADSGKFGLYHATNSGACSRYQFTREILEMAGLGGVPVEPTTHAEFGLPCPRPEYSPLDNMRLRLQGFPPSRHYREPLREYVDWLTADESRLETGEVKEG